MDMAFGGVVEAVRRILIEHAILIGQTVLVLPILVSLVYGALFRLDPELPEALKTLGATPHQRSLGILLEGRIAVAAPGRVFTGMCANILLFGANEQRRQSTC